MIGSDDDKPPFPAKRKFKKLRLNHVALVDEPCVPGSDMLVVKAKNKDGSPTDHESEQESARHGDRGVFERVEKGMANFAALSSQLQSNEISTTDFLAIAGQLAKGLNEEADRASEPVAKAARAGATIITETTMDLEALSKAVDELSANLETVTKAKDAAEAKVVTLTAERDEAVAKAKPADTKVEQTEEDVLKALPAPMRAIIEKSRKEASDATTKLAAMETEAVEKARKADETELVAKAKDWGHTDDFGKALASVKAKVDPTVFETITKGLDAAKTQASHASILASYGADVSQEALADPQAALDARSRDVAKTKNVTFEQAQDAVLATPEGQALYNEVAKRKRAAA